MTEDFSIVNGLIGLATLLSLVFINSALMHRFKKFESAISGKPTLLVHNGQFIEEAMNKARVILDEVFATLQPGKPVADEVGDTGNRRQNIHYS